MTDVSADVEDEQTPKSKKGLVLGMALALLGGVSGYFVTSSGMLSSSGENSSSSSSDAKEVVFIPVDQLTIALGSPSDQRFLRFRASIEVKKGYEDEVTALLPRVVDVLNTYLRSLNIKDIEDPSSLLLLRSQMRRRIDLVVGGGKVHDLLVMEFVVN